MGTSSSKEATKDIDNNGAINNNVILREDAPVYNVYSVELITLIGILVILRIVEFAYFVVKRYRLTIKKKYGSNNSNQRV